MELLGTSVGTIIKHHLHAIVCITLLIHMDSDALGEGRAAEKNGPGTKKKSAQSPGGELAPSVPAKSPKAVASPRSAAKTTAAVQASKSTAPASGKKGTVEKVNGTAAPRKPKVASSPSGSGGSKAVAAKKAKGAPKPAAKKVASLPSGRKRVVVSDDEDDGDEDDEDDSGSEYMGGR